MTTIAKFFIKDPNTLEKAIIQAKEKNDFWNKVRGLTIYKIIKHNIYGEKSIKQLLLVQICEGNDITYEVTYYRDGLPQVCRPFRKSYKTLKGAEKKFKEEIKFINS